MSNNPARIGLGAPMVNALLCMGRASLHMTGSRNYLALLAGRGALNPKSPVRGAVPAPASPRESPFRSQCFTLGAPSTSSARERRSRHKEPS